MVSHETRRVLFITVGIVAVVALTATAFVTSRRNNATKAKNDKSSSTLGKSATLTDLRRRADAAVQSDDYEGAAELYTRAITAAIAANDGSMDSSLYTNRAWCYANMLPPRHDEVVKDCDAALAMDPLNAMAVLRRSVALQGLKESAGNR